jgi:hypothetical protein
VVRTIDRAFGWLLVLGGLLHAVGSVKGLANRPDVLVWALSGSLAALLLAAINLMRVNRPDDRPLAWVSTAGSIAWGSFMPPTPPRWRGSASAPRCGPARRRIRR